MLDAPTIPKRHAALAASNILTASPILAHSLHRILTHGGASAPDGRKGRCEYQREAEYRKLPSRDGKIDAPIEGLAIDHVDQDQAQCRAKSETIRYTERAREDAFAGQHADDLPAQHADMPQHAELG